MCIIPVDLSVDYNLDCAIYPVIPIAFFRLTPLLIRMVETLNCVAYSYESLDNRDKRAC